MVLTLQEIVQSSIYSVFNTDWLGTAVLALMFSAVLSSLAWMISTIFQSNEIKGWARKELSEFLLTGIILALTIPLLLTITAITVVYANGDPFILAKNYLDKVESQLIEIYAYLSASNIIYTAVASFKLDLGLIAKVLTTIAAALAGASAGGIGGILSGGLAAIANFLIKYKILLGLGSPFSIIVSYIDTLTSLTVPVLLAFFVQKEILLFIQAAALPVILPTGILLRAFPLTRKAGSTLIAISLTLFIVYPLTLAFVGSMYDQTYNQMIGNPISQNQINPESTSLFYRNLPVAGKYRLDYNQEFKFTALKNISYSFWKDIPCNTVSGQAFESFLDSNSKSINVPPESLNYNYWKINNKETIQVWVPGPSGVDVLTEQEVTTSKCYYRFINNSAEANQEFGFILNTSVYSSQYNNTNHSIILLAFNKEGTAPENNVEIYDFFLGDPCKESTFSNFWCWLGLGQKEDEINDISYLSLSADALKGGLSGIGSSIKTISTGAVSNFFITPYAAGYVFYSLSDSMPNIILPYLIVIFTFVIILMVTISTFKSISTTLGGETKLIELGRLV